ncbi:hypothetical protein PIB30_115346, partial [Stylosanthes scabra]|nr:hypothetical protein [Stylosanthes scabra]
MEPEEEDLRLQSEAIIETEETLELKYMGAVSRHRSIRAWAMVKGHRVRVLIDCGA